MFPSPYLYNDYALGVRLALAIALFFLTVVYTKRGLQNGILLGLIVAMPGMPIRLFYSSSFLPIITLERVVWPIIWAIFFLQRRQGKTARLPLDGVECSMLVFTTFLLLSLMRFGNYVSQAGGVELATLVQGFAIPFSTYFIVRRSIRTDQQLQAFFVGLGFIALFLACNGLAETMKIQWLVVPQFILNPQWGLEGHLEEGRLRGIFLVAGPHGLAIAMALPFLIWLYFTDGVPRRWLWPVVAVVAMVVLACTFSRAGWLSGITALGVTALAWPRRRVVFTGIIVYVAAVGFFFASEAILQKFEARLTTQSTIEGRIGRIELAWAMFQAHPVFGAGFNRFALEADQYGRSLSHAHNTWMTLLAELGVTGFLSYLAIFGCALFRSGKYYWHYPQYRVILGILVGVTLAFMILSITMEIRTRLYHNTLLFALWAMILEAVCRRIASGQRIAVRQVSVPRVIA